MQFILTFISALFAALFAVAAPTNIGANLNARAGLAVRDGSSSCSAGPVLCCDSVESANNLSSNTTSTLGALGISVGDLLNDIGVGCSSLSGGADCPTKTLCCEDNTFSGLVSLGCSDVGAGL
ncbi:uncharacterized protein B0H18DRAFT_1118383 [Fomitopsis serialis]|uniref:uncharacterized protein n=1 Tax=Fomitopsis serialis TaxID=139415 RepID=UPI002007B403|nr:uncharacterized protein B0H18DRAFT_1118383 [Neoantrodia serialis]KAH9927575.1 hypothetical protein B0H18DRAFT_1118383 [Neoantrodia serialis]